MTSVVRLPDPRRTTRDQVVRAHGLNGGLDLDVRAGEVVALIGRGASALLRVLAGRATPTAGSAVVVGCDVRTDPAGVRRRTAWAGPGRAWGAAVPDLLVLDNPTTGLDARARAAFWADVLALRTTVLLTTHHLAEVDAVAERVVVLDHGEVVADDSAGMLKAETGDVVRLTTTSPRTAVQTARVLGEVQSAHVDGSLVTLRVTDGPGLLPRLLPELSGVSSVTLEQATLDDVVEALTLSLAR